MPRLLLGCISDDFTGATDLANTLVRQGMRVLQAHGVPQRPLDEDVDAVVVALKTRTTPPEQAVADSTAAWHWLAAQGARRFYLKICSTFDSTPQGNIGPVAEALMQACGTDFVLVTPAFPDNGRTVFRGHLFVGDVLLSDSGMRSHPLTPMTDPNLVRVLQAQCRRRVGRIDEAVVAAGADAVRARMEALRADGIGLAIADAISNDDLLTLGAALGDARLMVGASGLAIGLPRLWGIAAGERASPLPSVDGPAAIVCGSCSQATQRQVRHFVDAGGEAFLIDPLRLARDEDVVAEALAFAGPRLGQAPPLVYSCVDASGVQRAQSVLGAARAGSLVEQALAAVARALVVRGARRLVVAGGETAGACVQALGIEPMRIGAQIDPGVPWCFTRCELAPDGLHLALKSGNFGADDFFRRAFEVAA